MELRELSVLVVDDSEALNRLYTKYLTQGGYIVHSVHSLADAQAFLQTHRPDGIVLDLDLGDGNGQELIATLKQQDEFDQTKIIVVSGTLFTSPQNLRVDAADFALVKPVSPRQLLAMVRQLLPR